jgi:hypothetical protein
LWAHAPDACASKAIGFRLRLAAASALPARGGTRRDGLRWQTTHLDPAPGLIRAWTWSQRTAIAGTTSRWASHVRWCWDGIACEAACALVV